MGPSATSAVVRSRDLAAREIDGEMVLMSLREHALDRTFKICSHL